MSRQRFIGLLLHLLVGLILTVIFESNIDPEFVVAMIVVFILLSAAIVRFDPLHPAVWLNPFLFLYHFSAVILSFMDLWELQYRDNVMQIGWISIFVCSFVSIALCTKKINMISLKVNPRITNKILLIFYLVCLFLSIIHNFSFLALGIKTKAEAALSNMLPIGFAHNWFILAYTLLLVKKLYSEKKFPVKLFVVSSVVSLFSTLNLGERNIILSFAISTLFLCYLYYKPRKLFVFGVAGILVLLIQVLGSLKNAFTREDISVSFSNLFMGVFSGEFVTAGRNIDDLLVNKNMWDFFDGQTLIWDVGRSIVPGTIYSFQNATRWFNQTFHADIVARGRGYGFTLSGEGYINYGLFGVVIWMMITVGILALLYYKAKDSLVWLSVYILSIPYFIYSIRGDLSTLISPIMKSILFVFLLMIITGEILLGARTRRKAQNNQNA